MSIEFDKKVQVNTIIENQLPQFLVADFPNATEFFKQYYLSQEFQGANIDLVDNLDNYLKVDNLVPEVVIGTTNITDDIDASHTTITVESTKGFPNEYGLLKIDDEIITYTSKTDINFFGCIRGFSGISNLDGGTSLDVINKQDLVFEQTQSAAHTTGATVTNLSVLFLQEFYQKLKKTFLPGLALDGVGARERNGTRSSRPIAAIHHQKGIGRGPSNGIEGCSGSRFQAS